MVEERVVGIEKGITKSEGCVLASLWDPSNVPPSSSPHRKKGLASLPLFHSPPVPPSPLTLWSLFPVEPDHCGRPQREDRHHGVVSGSVLVWLRAGSRGLEGGASIGVGV